jgi:hypothetical protein
MVKRARVHSRDIQPQIVAPQGLFAAARVQRLDFPLTIPTTSIDELGRRLHVGTTQETPEIRVSFEAFDVSHNTFSYLTGYTPATFPVSGASVTQFQNIDMIGQIRNANTSKIVNAIYAKKLAITGMDASFDVKGNSSVTYTAEGNSKKEFSKPVFYDSFTASGAQANLGLGHTPVYLTRTSGYVINAYAVYAAGTQGYLTEGTDFTVTGTNVALAANAAVGDKYWFTYCAAVDATFEALDDTAPAAIQGKYVPVTIGVSNIQRVQSVRLRAAMAAESIMEMGGLGKPVGYETGIPDVTGDISVLKTDDDLIALLEGVNASTVENDMEFARTDLPLKVQLKNPANPSQVLLTYYLPSLTWSAEGDESTVNQSMNETFSFTSTTGQMYVASGNGPW